MPKVYESNEHTTYFASINVRIEIILLLIDTLVTNPNNAEVVEKNLQRIAVLTDGIPCLHLCACFGSIQAELLWHLITDQNLFLTKPKIRELTIHILAYGAASLFVIFNPNDKLSSNDNVKSLLDVIINPQNENEKQDAVILLKYIMQSTTKKLDDPSIPDFLAINKDKIPPSAICYVLEHVDIISEPTADILTSYLLNFITENQNSEPNDNLSEQLTLALKAISYIPKASEKHAQVYSYMEEYLQSDIHDYNVSGLVLAGKVSLNLETIKNSILKFLNSEDSSILYSVVSTLISCQAVWSQDDECCCIIMDHMIYLLSFPNGKIQDKAVQLYAFVDPMSTKLNEEILDILIEMLATKHPMTYEILVILIDFVANLRRGTIECDMDFEEFQSKIQENEIEIIEAIKNYPMAQEIYQRLEAVINPFNE